jgi:hypothetical protein
MPQGGYLLVATAYNGVAAGVAVCFWEFKGTLTPGIAECWMERLLEQCSKTTRNTIYFGSIGHLPVERA